MLPTSKHFATVFSDRWQHGNGSPVKIQCIMHRKLCNAVWQMRNSCPVSNQPAVSPPTPRSGSLNSADDSSLKLLLWLVLTCFSNVQSPIGPLEVALSGRDGGPLNSHYSNMIILDFSAWTRESKSSYTGKRPLNRCALHMCSISPAADSGSG